MANKYYIESGSFRVLKLSTDALSAVSTSISKFLNLSSNSVARLSDVIAVSQKSYPLELFDSSQLDFLTGEEIIQRQKDYVIVCDLQRFIFDPPEDIIFLSTKQVLNHLGLGLSGDEIDLSIYRDGLNVR